MHERPTLRMWHQRRTERTLQAAHLSRTLELVQNARCCEGDVSVALRAKDAFGLCGRRPA